MTEPIALLDAPFDWDGVEIPAHARGGRVTLNLYDELSKFVPRRPGVYLRISSDRFGLEAGVDRQLEDAEDTRSRLRWGPFAKVYKENDTSAFKKRKITRSDGSVDWVVIRPEFRRLLADLAAGVIDGVIFYDLDRLVRQPRDLEDLIDIVEHTQRPVVGATGGRMNLINDSDRHMARLMCVMALKSSEDTARRVARSKPSRMSFDVVAAPDLLVEPFLRVVRPDRLPDRAGERGEGEQVLASVLQVLGCFGESLVEGGEHSGHLLADGLRVGLFEDDPQQGRGPGLGGLGDLREQIPGVVRSASLPGCPGQGRSDRVHQSCVGVGDDEPPGGSSWS
ncbi:hypothetical protein GCM10009738_12580 [Kitasatospora viridis]|uniref:Resolvase-like protein n=1 Tax=Kitasatospora viridis TaxID=281105 RepID=A0A561SDE2_9ACTN|nr:resolvase-like protein [Kitasatospora viridis]